MFIWLSIDIILQRIWIQFGYTDILKIGQVKNDTAIVLLAPEGSGGQEICSFLGDDHLGSLGTSGTTVVLTFLKETTNNLGEINSGKSEYQNLENQMKALEETKNAQSEKLEEDKAELKKAYAEV